MALVQESTTEASKDFLRERFVAACNGDPAPAGFDFPRAMQNLSLLPERTIGYLAGSLRDDQSEDDTLDRMILFMIGRGVQWQYLENVAHIYKTNEVIRDNCYGSFEWDDSYLPYPNMYLKEILSGLSAYRNVESFSFDEDQSIPMQGELVMSQCTALILVAEALEMQYEWSSAEGSIFLVDEELADLVARRPDQAWEIISAMGDLDSERVPLIEAYISGEAPKALVQGHL